ncbi:MAG: CpaF family protein [Lachnospiraceae bacterium]|jgi:pilus assembly protein CpaF|nr:CpaF family protein [Lachnospiraceae bacterium]
MLDKQARSEMAALVQQIAGGDPDMTEARLKEIIDDVIMERSLKEHMNLEAKKEAAAALYASVRGMDELEELIADPDITEIMVNGPDEIFVEKAGRILRHEGSFESREKLEDVIQKIAAGSNRLISTSSPIADARLKDGSRVNLILPPVSVRDPVITIRKFPKEVMTIAKLIELGSISEEAAGFLEKLVKAGYNIFVSGGTGSGKTTFLNALSNFVPRDQRIITIEDSAELQIREIPNLVSLEVRNANVEGKNEITIRDLIKTSLRMRPDRIIVGEVRDGACIDMLQALNTGHCGMSTGHANSTADALSRLETMVLLGGTEIPLQAVRRQIASAIDIIIQLGRFRDRSRRVLEITEVAGCERDEIILNPLYVFIEEGEDEGRVTGNLRRTQNPLVRTAKLKSAGL